ncbi:MAG TPA: hypothetical protein VFE54_13105, partial [Mucilaginibacter sp.]|nr:hypothetical protein [Mucilaginibacter sp.]
MRIYYTDLALSKEHQIQSVPKIDTQDIKAKNDTIAYKKALITYYIRLTSENSPHSDRKTHSFVIEDDGKINLELKLSKNTIDSLDNRVRNQIETMDAASGLPLLPDSVKPKGTNSAVPALLKKINSADIALMDS